jgi:hypothetical protein
MNTEEYFIVLYSKYSNISKLFSNYIKESVTNLNIQILCIDNPKIRNKIENDLNIKELPCLLVVKKDNIETYSGNDAYKWVEEIIKLTKKTLPPPVPKEARKKKITIISDDYTEDASAYESTLCSKNKDIGKRPPMGMRTNAGNFEFGITEPEKGDEPVVVTGIKKETFDKQEKKLNIVSVAAAMQKSREEFDHANKKN